MRKRWRLRRTLRMTDKDGGEPTKTKDEKDTEERKKPRSADSDGADRSERKPKGKRRPAPELIREVRDELVEMIGRPVEGVLGIERNEDGWLVAVQVVELERIPSSTDVLGRYEVTVSDEGEVTGIWRTNRYYRSQAGED
jgi:hypothetical protein